MKLPIICITALLGAMAQTGCAQLLKDLNEVLATPNQQSQGSGTSESPAPTSSSSSSSSSTTGGNTSDRITAAIQSVRPASALPVSNGIKVLRAGQSFQFMAPYDSRVVGMLAYNRQADPANYYVMAWYHENGQDYWTYVDQPKSPRAEWSSSSIGLPPSISYTGVDKMYFFFNSLNTNANFTKDDLYLLIHVGNEEVYSLPITIGSSGESYLIGLVERSPNGMWRISCAPTPME